MALANFPPGYSHNGQDPFDEVDALAADVHASIKKRGDSFEGDQQLEVWLAEDGINTTPELLRDAVLQLEISGWLSRPYREHEWSRGPLPGYLVSPSWTRDWY